MADEHDDKTHRYEEALKLCFDGCKHMSTLSTAAAGLLVAIYREDMIDSIILSAALVFLAMSILWSLAGLLLPARRFITVGGGGDIAFTLLFISIGFFILGVLLVGVDALNLPDWLGFLVGFVLPLAFGVAYTRFGKLRS
jgi:hypothetical protein